MVIDFHTHCFADSVAKAAISSLEETGSITAVHNGTINGLKKHMKACGVDKSVILPIATKPSQVRVINEWAKENTDDKINVFGTLHPEDKDLASAAAKLKEDGFVGVKLHPDYQHFFADEPRMMPLYEMLRDLGLIVMFHAGVDIGYPALVHCTPLMIKNILGSVKGLTLIAAHMGSHGLWRDVEELLVGEDVFFDTSYSYYKLKNSGMERLINKHGAEKILFGTDSPWRRQDEAIKTITSLNLPSSDIDKILYKNALSLLD